MLRFALLALLLVPLLPREANAQNAARNVVINRQRLDDGTVRALEQRYLVRIQDGTYWYDAACGAWGFAGGPTVGFILPGLRIGGPLRADASAGTTGVFVNGRELHAQDVAALRQLVGAVYPGRYWLDAYGNVGAEGGPALLNLVQVARSASGNRHNAFYRSGATDVGVGGSGDTFYVMGKDWSVTVTN